jgi:hypothetical protein
MITEFNGAAKNAMTTETPDDIYTRWVEWLDTIAKETISLWRFRDYWRGLAEMTQSNPNIPPSTIFNVLGIWYGGAMMTGIRDRPTATPAPFRCGDSSPTSLTTRMS